MNLNQNDFFRTIPKSSWSTVHNRCLTHDGVIVDLGCLWWDWSSYFIGKKKIIGVDPQEQEKEGTTFFKGAVTDFTGKGQLVGSGQAAKLIQSDTGFNTLTWKDFTEQFNIDSISILKVNVEGEEYKLIPSLTDEDFSKIDQIAISFHHFVNQDWWGKTVECLDIIKKQNFSITDLGIWGWYLCVKN